MRIGMPLGRTHKSLGQSVNESTQVTQVSSNLFCIPNDFGAAAELSCFICRFYLVRFLLATRDILACVYMCVRVCVCDYHLPVLGHGDKVLLASERAYLDSS